MKDIKQLPHQQYLASLNKPFKEHTKEERKEYCRLWRLTNNPPTPRERLSQEGRKERRRRQSLEYYYKNKEKLKVAFYKRVKANPERYRPSTNPALKMRLWIHNNMRRIDENKTSWIDNIGCTKDEFKAHIESQFVEGMSWDNWSKDGWHIDHIIPLSKGGTNHYTNLQPLWAIDNLSKSNKIV